MKRVLLFAMLALSSLVFAQSAVVTQAEWFIGTDPGVGNGNALTIGSPEAQEPLAFEIATGSFSAGDLIRAKVRCKIDSLRSGATNVWGVATDAYLILAPATGVARLVTSMAYQIDNGAFTNVDVADADNANFSEIVSTVGLTNGVHRLRVRSTDDLGRIGLVVDGFLVISNTAGFAPRVVTNMEYRIDGGSFTSFDYPDNGIVNFNEVIATNALDIGLHTIDMRSIDDLGRTGEVHRAYLIVSSPFVGGVARTLTAAEVFVGSDPGVGNGIAIPLPQDGAFDEGTEDFLQVYTNFPVGYYRVGFRTRDDLGRWSQAEFDSLLVGPILTVLASGNNAVLNWQFPDGIDQYYVYRSPNTAGPFTVIDSTTLRTYTDPGIFSAQDKGFYYVTFRDDSISIHQPGGTPVQR